MILFSLWVAASFYNCHDLSFGAAAELWISTRQNDLTKVLKIISAVFICSKIHRVKKEKAASQQVKWMCAQAVNLVFSTPHRHASLTNFQSSKKTKKKQKKKANLQQFLTSVPSGVSLFPTFAPIFFCHHRALTRRKTNRPKVVQDSGASARLSWVAAGEWMVMRHRPQSQRDVPEFDGTLSWGGVMSAAKVGLGVTLGSVYARPLLAFPKCANSRKTHFSCIRSSSIGNTFNFSCLKL